MTDDAILLEFAPEDTFAADYLGDAENLAPLEAIAAEVFGRTMSLRTNLKSQPPEGGAEKPAAARRDDPVIQAFAKHLGGEVVRPKKKSKEPS